MGTPAWPALPASGAATSMLPRASLHCSQIITQPGAKQHQKVQAGPAEVDLADSTGGLCALQPALKYYRGQEREKVSSGKCFSVLVPGDVWLLGLP